MHLHGPPQARNTSTSPRPRLGVPHPIADIPGVPPSEPSRHTDDRSVHGASSGRRCRGGWLLGSVSCRVLGATGPHEPTPHAFPPLWMWPRLPTHPRPPGLRRNLDQPGCRLPQLRHRAPRVNKGACDAAGGGAAEDTTIGSGWVGQSPLTRFSRVRIKHAPRPPQYARPVTARCEAAPSARCGVAV